MQVSSVLFFTAFAIATQSPLDERPECVSQLWEVHNLTMFTANPASSLGSFLYFAFIDPNSNMRSAPATCGFRLNVATEGEKNSLLGYDYVKCTGGDGNNTSFRYNGDNITVARTGVRCGSGLYLVEGTVSTSTAVCDNLENIEDNILTGQWCQAENTLSMLQSMMPRNGIDPPLPSTSFLPLMRPPGSSATSGLKMDLVIVIMAVFTSRLVHML